jgi:hypothetical protein
MPYTESDMIFSGYKRSAQNDRNNPYYVSGNEHSELNRGELNEMLYFINHISRLWKWEGNPTSSYNKMERLIKTQMPSNIRTHRSIELWLQDNWEKY